MGLRYGIHRARRGVSGRNAICGVLVNFSVARGVERHPLDGRKLLRKRPATDEWQSAAAALETPIAPQMDAKRGHPGGFRRGIKT